jgi:hypothetical protein
MAITLDERDEVSPFEEQIRKGIIAEMKAGARPIPLDYKKPVINGRHFNSRSIVKQVVRALEYGQVSEEVVEQYNYEVEGKSQQEVLKISLDYVMFEDYEYKSLKSGYKLGLCEIYDYEEEDFKYRLSITGSGEGDSGHFKQGFQIDLSMNQNQFFELFNRVQQNRDSTVYLKPEKVYTTMDYQSVRVIKDKKSGEMEVRIEQEFDWVDKQQVIDYYKQIENKNARRRANSKSSTSKARSKPTKV